jgi:pyruvate/2-oxoglutarate dehydrogenase complex dihydrolipoamide acyltransferase (E2) component
MTGTKLTGWRKIAHSIWDAPNDPQIFGVFEVDSTNLLAYRERARAAGHRLTATLFVGRALAIALREVPDLNVRIALGRVTPRERVEVFFIATVEGGRDLSGVKIADADRKSILEVAAELQDRARTLKGGKDKDFARTKSLMDALPSPLLRIAAQLSSFVTGGLGKDIPALGLKADAFGGAMVSGIGALGLPMGFAPIAWMYRVPMLALVGEIADKPVAVDGRVEVRPMLPICMTLDHRYMDGWHAAKAFKHFRAYLEAPAAYEPEITEPGPVAGAAA